MARRCGVVGTAQLTCSNMGLPFLQLPELQMRIYYWHGAAQCGLAIILQSVSRISLTEHRPAFC